MEVNDVANEGPCFIDFYAENDEGLHFLATRKTDIKNKPAGFITNPQLFFITAPKEDAYTKTQKEAILKLRYRVRSVDANNPVSVEVEIAYVNLIKPISWQEWEIIKSKELEIYTERVRSFQH